MASLALLLLTQHLLAVLNLNSLSVDKTKSQYQFTYLLRKNELEDYT